MLGWFRPDDPHVRITLGNARSDAGLHDEALQAFDLVHQRPLAWALAWFPPDQRAGALEPWPDLAEDFQDPVSYARRLEQLLRGLDRDLGQHPAVAPIDVHEFTSWATAEGHDRASGRARSVYAAELHRIGQAIAWPPGRNDPCWCRSGRKYKRCCGAS